MRITGVVVAIDEFSGRRILTVDDSSGSCIECVCAIPSIVSVSKPAETTGAAVGRLNQFQVQIHPHRNGNESLKYEDKAGQGGGKPKPTGSDQKTEQPSAQNPLIPWQDVDIGSVLKIKGQITSFRDMKQVDVIKIDIIRGTEAEVKCWEEVYTFRQSVLSKPWVVTEEEGRLCEEKSRVKERSGVEKHRVGKDSRTKGDGNKAPRKTAETEEERRRRHEAKKRKKGKEKEAEGLDPAKKIKYPSIAVQRRAAGKYDTLGI